LGEYICTLCPGKLIISKKSVHRHLVESVTHANSVPGSQIENHEKMIQLITEKIKGNKIKWSNTLGVKTQEKKNNLKFLGFCQSLNLSFPQISDLGKFFKELSNKNQLSFLKEFTFEREEISWLARFFGSCLIEQVKKI